MAGYCLNLSSCHASALSSYFKVVLKPTCRSTDKLTPFRAFCAFSVLKDARLRHGWDHMQTYWPGFESHQNTLYLPYRSPAFHCSVSNYLTNHPQANISGFKLYVCHLSTYLHVSAWFSPLFGLLLLYLSVIGLCKQPVRLLKGSHKSHVDITKIFNFILSHYIILYVYIYDL